MCADIQKVTGLFDEAGPYINIGAFSVIEKLEKHFIKVHGNPDTIKFQFAMFVPNLPKQSFQNFAKHFQMSIQQVKMKKLQLFIRKIQLHA